MIYENIEAIHLASSSPRRQELLSGVGLVFDVLKPGGEDTHFKFKSPRYYAEKKADLKMDDVLRANPDIGGCVITADTIVVKDRNIIEKPKDGADAERMLKALEGKWHTVFTAYCICIPSKNVRILKSFRSQVKFKPLGLREIRNYIATGEPLDKAGAYAIQGQGSFMIEGIEGSYSNIIGLPLSDILSDLIKLDVIRPRKP